jgi:hypothetical protein
LPALTPERLQSLAAAAIAAPSADNHHVFWLEGKGDELDLVAAPAFVSAPLNRRILGLISIGAVIENLTLRAARLGVRLETTQRLDSPSVTSPLLVRFRCLEGPAEAVALERAIEERHSNRRLRFRGPALPADARASMSALADDIEGARLIWLDADALRRRALWLIRLAEAQRFCNKELHRELFGSIRFDAGWERTTSEGLPPGTLALPWVEQKGFAMLRHWNIQRAANLIGMHRFMAWRAADLPCRLSPHVCAIAAEGDIDAGALRAGRLMQRVWLQATNRQLSFQVFAASALYALDGFAPIADRIRTELNSNWAKLCPVGRPYLVFRMGCAKSPSMRAGRPRPEELLR